MTAGHPWWTPLQVAEKHPCRLPDGKPVLTRCKSGSRCGRTPKRTAFPGPARTDEGTAPVSMAGAIAPATAPRWSLSGRGPKPAASARPAPGGRFAPAGSGAGLRRARTCRSAGDRPARAGETRVAFPDPARTDESAVTASLAGAIAPATVQRRYQDQPGAKAPGQRPPRPWRALLARRVGRWPLSLPDRPVFKVPSRAGGGNAGRVS
jgi:hypothetical protein